MRNLVNMHKKKFDATSANPNFHFHLIHDSCNGFSLIVQGYFCPKPLLISEPWPVEG